MPYLLTHMNPLSNLAKLVVCFGQGGKENHTPNIPIVMFNFCLYVNVYIRFSYSFIIFPFSKGCEFISPKTGGRVMCRLAQEVLFKFPEPEIGG